MHSIHQTPAIHTAHTSTCHCTHNATTCTLEMLRLGNAAQLICCMLKYRKLRTLCPAIPPAQLPTLEQKWWKMFTDMHTPWRTVSYLGHLTQQLYWNCQHKVNTEMKSLDGHKHTDSGELFSSSQYILGQAGPYLVFGSWNIYFTSQIPLWCGTCMCICY